VTNAPRAGENSFAPGMIVTVSEILLPASSNALIV
jgi:hypothetical protein